MKGRTMGWIGAVKQEFVRSVRKTELHIYSWRYEGGLCVLVDFLTSGRDIGKGE